jgi:MarR family 2-MHQ and catechol resistance regulon transcriptional repressor
MVFLMIRGAGAASVDRLFASRAKNSIGLGTAATRLIGYKMKKRSVITAPRLWLVIAKSYHALSLQAERSIANTGLCLTDFVALEALLHKGPLTISEIQEKVRLASGSMTAAVDRLEKLGLVVRKSSPTDRRARVVHLTAAGKRLAVSCFDRHAKDLEALMSALSQKEKEQLYESLKKLGLLAAEQLHHHEVKANGIREQARKMNMITE